MSDYEFGEFWLKSCKRKATLKDGGFVYCDYKEKSDGVNYYYMTAFYRSMYAYFVVLFMTVEELRTAARKDFMEYAENLYFTV